MGYNTGEKLVQLKMNQVFKDLSMPKATDRHDKYNNPLAVTKYLPPVLWLLSWAS